MKHTSSNPPIFIVGIPRSGTTLMSSMLSAHPRITIAPKTDFITHLMRYNNTNNLSKSNNIEKECLVSFFKMYSQSECFSYLGIDPQKTLQLILTDQAIDYRTIFTSILQEYSIKMKKSRYGEKNPAYYQYVNILLHWYPYAKIIWMLRDPRAVFASLLKTPWGNPYADINAKRWRDSIHTFEQQWIDDTRLCLVKYEALVNSPESELKRICEFLREEYSPAMISDRSEINSPIINRSGWSKDYLQASLRPVNEASVEKWRYSLSSSQVAIVEHITKNEMQKYGYEPVKQGLNTIQLSKLFITKIGRRVKQIFIFPN